MRTLLRHLPRAFAFGILATIAGAWLLALTPAGPTRGPLSLPCGPRAPNAWRTDVLASSSYSRYEWAPLSTVGPDTDWNRLQAEWKLQADAFVEHPPGVDMEWPSTYLMRVERWPDWAQLPLTTHADTGLAPDQGLSIDARGFPLPALLCSTIIVSPAPIRSAPPIPHPVRSGIAIQPPSGAMNDGWRALPLRPIPANFAFDTLLFAVLYFLALKAVTLLRDIRADDRRARSHCPTCNYARQGLPPASPCPECGAAYPSTSPTQNRR